MFVKESSVILSRLLPINPFLRGTFGVIGTSFKYDESVQEFMRAAPEIGQQQYEEFVHDGLITCQKLVSDPIKKNKFSTPAKPRPNGTSDKGITINAI